MFEVATRIGTFKLIDGELVSYTNEGLLAFYNLVMNSLDIVPSDGPLDYAIGIRMVGRIQGDYKILDAEYDDDKVVY